LVFSPFAFNAQGLSISYKNLTVNAAYDPMTAIANITLGKHPYCVATNDVTNRVYVGVDGGLMVINGETDHVIAEIPLGNEVVALAVNPLTNRIYVGIYGKNVTVFDGATNLKVGSIPEGLYYSYELAINPVTTLVYLADWSTVVGVPDRVRVYNGENFQFVTSIALGISPYYERVGVAVNSNTNEVYATWTGNHSLFLIDGTTHFITKNVIPSYASETVIVNSNTNRVYIGPAALNGENLEQITPSLNGEIKAVDPVHNFLYTISGSSMSRLDGSTHSLVDSLKLHWTFYSYQDRAAANPASSKIYITNYDGNQTCVFSAGVLPQPTPSPTVSSTPTPTPVIPEFPAWTVTPLLMVLILAGLVIHKRKQTK
jgi:DNA-binding beta-propeller fold protein YncE